MTVQLVGHNQLLMPGNCVSCGSCSEQRGYIDFGITVEFFGTPYICTECFPSVAEMMGYIPKANYADFQHLTKLTERAVFERDVTIEALKNVVAVLCTNPDALLDSVDGIVSAAVSRVEAADRLSKPDPGTNVEPEVSDESFGIEGFDDLLAATADIAPPSKRKSSRSSNG